MELLEIETKRTVFTQPSDRFKPKVEISALYIEHNGKILLLHRQDNKSQGNKWGIPGGKVDIEESPLQAAVRETFEETGFDFSKQPVHHVETVYIEYNETLHFVYHMYRTEMVFDPASIRINYAEHKGSTWVTPQDGLTMNLIDGEAECFRLTFNLI